MDERNTCFKKVYLEEYQNHLNSVNQNMQFIQEVEEESRLFFWTPQPSRCMERCKRVYKENNTQKQTDLDFNFHYPVQYKRSVEDTFRNSAEQILSTEAERSKERKVLFMVD